MAATPESKVKKAVATALVNAGAWFFFPAANGFGRAGIPDIIACINGRMLAIECKAGKGRTTALQDRELQRIKDAGGIAIVVNDEPGTFHALGYAITILKETT